VPLGVRGEVVTADAANLVHVLVAAGLTYAVGFERDLRGAGAGDRVFAMIGVGAGIVGVLAVNGAPAALTGVLTGVGFIGAGMIFRQEHPEIVRGLTTAAAILAAVAIGAAAGEGRLLLATVGTAIALVVLEVRYTPVLRMLDGRRWEGRFRHDESPPVAGSAAADDARGKDAGNLGAHGAPICCVERPLSDVGPSAELPALALIERHRATALVRDRVIRAAPAHRGPVPLNRTRYSLTEIAIVLIFFSTAAVRSGEAARRLQRNYWFDQCWRAAGRFMGRTFLEGAG
jgi:putative Mg2+ transporter-C (MgtC) family protein